MKQNLTLSLTDSNLSKPFYHLTIITVIISAFRLLITPEAIGIIFPLMVTFGILVVIAAILILLFALLAALTGGNPPDCNCNGRECDLCCECAKGDCAINHLFVKCFVV